MTKPKNEIRPETIEAMGNLLRMVRPHLVKCEHIIKNDDDIIEITCANGYKYQVFITANSEAATVAAVFDQMRHK